MADRFERLVALLLVLDRLGPYARAEMQPLVGREATARALSLLEARQSLVEREIAAIRLQYPRYVDQLETWTILRTAKAFAEEEFARLQQSGVINSEVMRDLLEDIEKRKTKLFSRPQLDLELDTTRLMTRSELFAPLSEAEKSDLARFLRPYFAAPGMTIIRKGERGDAAYFIASGAVEVTTATGRLQLGSGAILGEMAVLLAIPRQADVHAIAYSTLLRLSAADFAAFLQRHPHLRATVEALARARLAENQAASEA